ncbi:hypothetical protein SLEP1_g3049 [Rubroshorea leprosula]|uniref:HAUS augmin-like complex subunit 3 N-terminal domain-containing protein n=1 Tax=Rubroshorea leprosula TaxID=152421 RepID=A0AAV5HSV5_9ROSI|nr:hypothetical protein SLEP1_g3049 [Rubroshorea leprosula]
MSGGRLCALLSELGYQGADKLDRDSFEWPFQYEQFVQEGKLLEGVDLDFAYDSISAFSSRRDDQEAVFGPEEGLKDVRYDISSITFHSVMFIDPDFGFFST